MWSVSQILQPIFMLKSAASSICGKFWASCKNLFPSIVVIALLETNTFSKLSTNDENVSDGKENEGETNRKSHPAIGDEVCEEIMSSC